VLYLVPLRGKGKSNPKQQGPLKEEKELKNYEALLILKPDLEKEELDSLYGSIKEGISKHKGEVSSIKEVGKKPLAYKIGKFKDGIYYLVNLKMDPSEVPLINNDFKLNESIIRFMFTEQAHPEDRLTKKEEGVLE